MNLARKRAKELGFKPGSAGYNEVIKSFLQDYFDYTSGKTSNL